jgi:hypothetical protein
MALIDLGSQDNYISKAVMLRAGLQPTLKKESYTAVAANTTMTPIRHEVCAELNIAPGYTHQVILDVFEKASYDIILGLPWLED